MKIEKTPFEIIYEGVIQNLEKHAKGEFVDWKTIAGHCAEIAKKEIDKEEKL